MYGWAVARSGTEQNISAHTSNTSRFRQVVMIRSPFPGPGSLGASLTNSAARGRPHSFLQHRADSSKAYVGCARSGVGVAAVPDAEDVDDLAERDELGEHPRQLEKLVLGEAGAEVFPQGVVHGVVVGEEPVGVAERGLLALGERPALVVAERRHQLLRDALAPSQG